ncbi:MAG: TraR/DksA C4-type zinc finger protein [Chloroflexota bacterium]
MPVKYERLKAQLQAEKDRLQEEIQDRATVSMVNVGYGNHMADDATYAYEQTHSLSLQENAKSMLKQVESALLRFSEGTYGVCVSCGESIDPARLEALPYASDCLQCATNRSR